LFTLPGSPIIYYGDEIGMGDNIWLPDRNGVRTPMQWEDGPGARFSRAQEEMFYAPVIQSGPFGFQHVNVAAQRADRSSLWHAIRKMIMLRKAHPALGWGDFALAETGSQAVVAYWRRDAQERLLVVHNLSGQDQHVMITVPREAGTTVLDVLADTARPQARNERLELRLLPYQSLWLSVGNAL
jgi:maltose alpha-D-glucosyltransferase/alpha-amylase